MAPLHSSTFSFFKQLRHNNNREWFTDHKDQYLTIRASFEQWMADIAKKIAKFDSELTLQEAEQSVKIYRIYRDVRFSKDKKPYKTNLGGHISAHHQGMHHVPGYYVHIEPGNVFVGGGVYQPDSRSLGKIRDHIAEHHTTLSKITQKKAFIDTFGKVPFMTDGALKTIPRGFDKHHPAKEFLRLKHVVVGTSFSQKAVMSQDFDKEVIKVFKALNPLNEYLYQALR